MEPGRIPYKACPLCGEEAITDLLEADCSGHPLYRTGLPPTIAWCRCHRCFHVFADGYFNQAANDLLFSTSLPDQVPGYDAENQRSVWAPVVERVTQFAGEPTGRWMDVGFGNGSLLFTADEWGYATLGLDLRAASVARMNTLGHDARCCDIGEVDEPGAFQVISLADVIEHLPYPRAAIEHAATLLQPGGVLFVSTPNFETAAWKTMDALKDNCYWVELEHFHCFSRARLYALLRELGFEPLHYAVSSRYRSGMDVIARKRP
jgi:SAM-dependent methyltransferase